jgi:hypothetical protein
MARTRSTTTPRRSWFASPRQSLGEKTAPVGINQGWSLRGQSGPPFQRRVSGPSKRSPLWARSRSDTLAAYSTFAGCVGCAYLARQAWRSTPGFVLREELRERYGLRLRRGDWGLIKLFGKQAGSHAAHEQQSVHCALIACQHVMAGARRHGATLVYRAGAVRPQRVQQRQSFVSRSVPANPSGHKGVPISVDRGYTCSLTRPC